LLFWVTRVSHAEPADLGFRDWTGTNVARGIGVAAIAILSSQVILVAADQLRRALTDGPIKQPEQVQLDNPPELGTAILMGLAVLILAPVAEEAFFRGFIYRGLRRSYGILPSVLISGVIFGVIHVFAATSAADFTLFLQIVVPPLIVVGCIFALAVERTGSIVPTIVAHFLFNLLGFVQFMRNPVN
jgi:membrane protease YdiL (CAAX protease family)